MNRSLLASICCVSLFAASARSQQPTPADPLSSGTLVIGVVADYTQWVIDYKGANAAGSGTPVHAETTPARGPIPLVVAPPTRIVLTRTGNIGHKVANLADGQTDETWIIDESWVERRPGVPRLVTGLGGVDPLSLPEFNWISKDCFIGTKKFRGRDCLVFQCKMDPLRITNPSLAAAIGGRGPEADETVTAYVDSETRYPILVQIGADSRLYTISTIPHLPLAVPPDFTAAAAEAKARFDYYTKPLSPP